MFGVSRKTIQRDIKRGRLAQCGSAKRGRSARSLDIGELMALYSPQSKARRANARSAPVLPDLFQFLSGLCVNSCPVDPCFLVLCFILVTSHHESDSDFMAYCISRLIEHDEVFIMRIFGEDIPAAYNEFPHAYAAGLFRERLREVVTLYLASPDRRRNSLLKQNVKFSLAVHVLADRLHEMPAKITIEVSHDAISNNAEIRVVPSWWIDGSREQTTAFGPDFGFRRSMITPKCLIGKDSDKLAAKLAVCLYPPNSGALNEEALRLKPDRDKLEAFDTLRYFEWHDFRDDIGSPGIHSPVLNLVARLNAGVPKPLQVYPQEIRKLVSRLSALRAGGSIYAKLPRNVDEHGKKAKQNNGDPTHGGAIHSYRSMAMRLVLAATFGISRQTAVIWLCSGRDHHQDVHIWLAAYTDKLEALLR